MKEKAKNNFLGKHGKRYNCAQSVIKACEEKLCIPDKLIEEFAQFGGGRAPDGYCGGLYAALYLLNLKHGHKVPELKELFLAHAGALTCHEIKSGRKASCLECIEHAAEFLEKTFT